MIPEYEFGIPEVCESTSETKKRLEKKNNKELILLLKSVDQSIQAGFPHAIYYQEWSVGTEILRKRGLGNLSPKEIRNL